MTYTRTPSAMATQEAVPLVPMSHRLTLARVVTFLKEVSVETAHS
jgi:hypothetical protein